MRLLKKLFSKSKKQSPEQPAPSTKWSIGIYTGKTIFDLKDPGSGINPVLSPEDITDFDTNLVADPFMIRKSDTWHMFFEAEVKTEQGNTGKIGLASSSDGFNWKYEKMVLEEPFHLSYPYVFEHNNQIYMIPETRANRSIRLYRATDFPYKWTLEKEMLKGRRYADNSLFYYNGLWWMFTDAGNHTLRLYYTDKILGKWKEHKKSPILKKKPSAARPGGRVVIVDGSPVRFAQDAYPVYGSQVWGFKIIELTQKTYEEIPIETQIIKGSGSGWNGLGMHTVDPHIMEDSSVMACVDGLKKEDTGS